MSRDSDAMLNSKKTVSDIIAIVNYAIGKMRKPWNINESELTDLQQDGYIAAIRADSSYDPRRAAWSTWVLKRVNGQLRTSIERLRNFGITGTNSGHTKPLLNIAIATPQERDRDDEDIDSSVDELMSTEPPTDEAADVSSMVTTLLGCVDERSKHILSLYYGLDDGSPSLSTSQLARVLGYSKKHAFTLLQKAQQEARACLGV